MHTAAARDPTLLERCRQRPELLRDKAVTRELAQLSSADREELLGDFPLDSRLAWDIRAVATLLLIDTKAEALVTAFAEDFSAAVAERQTEWSAALELLAEWLRRGGRSRALEAALLPARGNEKLLTAVAGHPAHQYLWLLMQRRRPLPTASIPNLAATDDQDSRRLVCWYVGEHHLTELVPFLVDQITSPRPSTYPSQARRLFEAAFTAGISELIRAAAPLPEWLGERASPKGLALASLAELVPAGIEVPQTVPIGRLVTTAGVSARAKERAEWELAGEILKFVHGRSRQLPEGSEEVVAGLTRQPLRRRGPIAAFVLAEELSRSMGLPMPELEQDEQVRLWEIAHTTLDAQYLAAITRAYPDAEQSTLLEEHLLALGEAAARGTLHVVRTWGADIEGPGDWALAVAELGLAEALPDVERVLGTAYSEEAARALIMFGRAGAPALERFLLRGPGSNVDREVLAQALTNCVRYLEPAAVDGLCSKLGADRRLADVALEQCPQAPTVE